VKPKELLALAAAMHKGGLRRVRLRAKDGSETELEAGTAPPEFRNPVAKPRPTEALRAEAEVPRELREAGVDPETHRRLQERAAELMD
jgi:hypothetical protein